MTSVKLTPTAAREVRRLALDVVLLDGEQDEAPSLADMARSAKALLDGALRERRRPVKRLAPGRTREERREERNARAAEIRAAVMARADGRCEWCGRDGFVLQWAHIFEGGERTAREDVDTTAAACADCHLRGWHRNEVATLRNAKEWAIRLGFRDALHEIEKKIAKVEEARHALAGKDSG